VRKRITYLLLVVAVVVGARLLFKRPVDVELELQFGPAARALRDVVVVLTDEHDRVARELHLLYPSGAPAIERRRMSLMPGNYTAGVRLRSDGEAERRFNRTFRIDAAGSYSLDLVQD
jgi:hypothetical protein